MPLMFDGNTIESSTILIDEIDYYSIPTKEVSLFKIANADRSAIPFVEYPSKGIIVTGMLLCGGSTDLDEAIDNFKNYFRAKDANLDIPWSSSTRRYIATVNRLDIKRTMSLKHAKFTLEFICTEPFGLETSSTSLLSSLNYTSSSVTYTPTIGGTAPYQLPVITITIDALTGTGDSLIISNDLNGQQMLLYGLGLAATDVIVIDCDARTVTLNGTEVDYLGTFLELEPGASSITITDGFDTRTIDYVGVYYKRYL